VPALQALDYPVTYEEFDGGHDVPERVVDRAVSWMLAGN
jgi:predicted esterase